MYYIGEGRFRTRRLRLRYIYIYLVTYQTGYAGKSPLNLSYDNSFFKERSSAVGRGDGPV